MGTAEEPIPSWKRLAYEFTQDSTLHGIRYVTLETKFQLRRVLWLIAVLTSIAGFIYLNVANIWTYYQWPKSVNVEVTYRDNLTFPAVTVCNYNLFRLSGLSEAGLYDTFWEYYNDYGARVNSDECVESYYYIPGFCIRSPEEKDQLVQDVTGFGRVFSQQFSSISEIACERMCTNLYDMACSGIFYNRTSKECEVTSVVFEPEIYGTMRSCGEDSLEYYRRLRCPDTGEMTCDYEGWYLDDVTSDCHLKNVDDTDEEWTPVTAQGNNPVKDHTTDTGAGSYLYMVETDKRPGYTAMLQTPYIQFNDSCLELYYFHVGTVNMTLNVEIIAEDLKVNASEFRNTSLGDPAIYISGIKFFNRIFIKLPDGMFTVKITGTRFSEPGLSGLALDDITVWPCERYYRDCKRTAAATEYLGTLQSSSSGDLCDSWSIIPTIYTDANFPDPGGINMAENYCRNPFGLEYPWCFKYPWVIEVHPCNVPYCECTENQFLCQSGKCIPQQFACNGFDECGDGSDELEDRCPSSLGCDFSEPYMCGYQDSRYTDLIWQRMRGLDVTDGIGPTEDNEGSVIGYFVMASATSGVEGDFSLIQSPFTVVKESQCLSFSVFLVFSEASSFNQLAIYHRRHPYKYAMPTKLYDFRSWDRKGWHNVIMSIEPGEFQYMFAFTMGFAYQCDAAIDDISIAACPSETEAILIEEEEKYTYLSGNFTYGFNCTFHGGDFCGYESISSNARGSWTLVAASFMDILLSNEPGKATMGECPIFHKQSGAISSPSYPSNYTTNSEECIALIKGPPGSKIKLTFHTFDLEAYDGECYDFITISTAGKETKLCNANWGAGRILDDLEEEVSIRFSSDDLISLSGFRATYQISIVDEDYTPVLSYDGEMSTTMYLAAMYSQFHEVTNKSCLSFRYNTIQNLTAVLLSEVNQTLLKVELKGSPWNWARLPVDPGYFQLALVADFSGILPNTITAVDDLLIEEGNCLDLYTEGSLACDFSTMDQCGYLDISDHFLRFARDRNQSGDPSVVYPSTKPFYYVMAFFNDPYTLTSRTLMSVPVVVEEASCLGFETKRMVKLQSSGEQPAYMSVLIVPQSENSTVLLLISLTGPDYAYYTVTLPQGAYRLAFRAEAPYNLIPIRHITVDDGPCATPTVSDTRMASAHTNLTEHASQTNETRLEPEMVRVISDLVTRQSSGGPVSSAAEGTEPITTAMPQGSTRPPATTTAMPYAVNYQVPSRPNIAAHVPLDELVRRAAHQEMDFITSCKWNGQTCREDEIVREMTDFGMCYTFNSGSNGNTYHADKQGSQYGLKLTLNIEQYEHTQGPNTDAGVKVHLRDQGDIANVRDVGSAAALSTHALLGIQFVKSESLGEPWGSCGDGEMKYFENVTYTRTRCQQECEIEALIAQCHCKLYYMPGDFPVCTTYEYLHCVLPRWSENPSFQNCTCQNACDVVGFAIEPSFSALSSLGVSQLLTSNVEDLKQKYLRALDLKHRTFPDIFEDFVKNLANIEDKLEEFLTYAEQVTALGPTSMFTLIGESLQQFVDMVLKDIESTFQNTERYVEVYKKLYQYNHDSVIRLLNETTNLVVFLAQHSNYVLHNEAHIDSVMMETVTNRLEGSLLETLEHLDIVFEASEFDMQSTAFYVDVADEEEYMPYAIFPNRSASEGCSQENQLQTLRMIVGANYSRTARGRNLSELLGIAGSLPYSELLLELRGFAEHYTVCTSYYKDFLEGLMNWRQSINITGTIDYGTQFIFEKEAKSVMEDKEWLKEEIYLPYVQDQSTKLWLAELLTDDQVSDINANMEALRFYIYDKFSTAIRAALTTQQEAYRSVYLTSLQKLQEFQYYISDDVRNFRAEARQMSIWLKPVSRIDSVNLVPLSYSKDEVWRTWPDYMDISYFLLNQAYNLLTETDADLIDVLQTALSDVDSEFTRRASSVANALELVAESLNEYAVTAKVDEAFILNNFLTLDVYYGELTYELIEQQQAYTISDLFSDMGGYLGLLIGASVLTVCEVLDLIIYNSIVKLTR